MRAAQPWRPKAWVYLLFPLRRLLDHLEASQVGRRRETLLSRALVARPPAVVLAAATHPAQPAVARQSQATGAPQATDPRHLRARQEVEAEVIRRRRHHQKT